jgi:hemoglobin
MQDASIFDRCGGFATVGNVVMAFYEKVLESKITRPYFERIDVPGLMVHQTKFVASIMGGPASFDDVALQQGHRGLDITDEAFDEMARLFRQTLQEGFGLSEADIEALMAEIHSRRDLIVSTYG